MLSIEEMNQRYGKDTLLCLDVKYEDGKYLLMQSLCSTPESGKFEFMDIVKEYNTIQELALDAYGISRGFYGKDKIDQSLNIPESHHLSSRQNNELKKEFRRLVESEIELEARIMLERIRLRNFINGTKIETSH